MIYYVIDLVLTSRGRELTVIPLVTLIVIYPKNWHDRALLKPCVIKNRATDRRNQHFD